MPKNSRQCASTGPRSIRGGPASVTRTVRVELSSGQQKVNATVDARDEARLLQLLDAARAEFEAAFDEASAGWT